MKNYIIWICVFTMIIAALVCYANMDVFRSAGKVTIENASGITVKAAKIDVCKSEFLVEKLEPGASRTFSYLVKGPKSGFDIELSLDSGETLKIKDGYVCDGMDNEHMITVLRDHIQISTINK